jgi:hypothetical protein
LDQIKKNERAGHAAWMGDTTAADIVCWGNLRKRDHLKDPGIDGKIILRGILNWNWGGGGMEWFDLAQNRDM